MARGFPTILVRNINVTSSALKVEVADVGIRSIEEPLLIFKIPPLFLLCKALLLGLVLSLADFDTLFGFDWARIFDTLNVEDIVVAETIDVHSLVFVQISASDVPKDGHCVELGILLLGLDGVELVCNHVGVINSPGKWSEFLHSNESG